MTSTFLPMDESAANYDVAGDARVLVVRPTSVGEWRWHLEVVSGWGSASLALKR